MLPVTSSTATTLAGRVRAALDAREMKAIDVEKAMGVTSGYMTRILQGKMVPGAEHAIGMAQALRVPVEWLVLGKGTMNREPSEALQRSMDLEVALAEAEMPPEVKVQARALYNFDAIERTKAEWHQYLDMLLVAWRGANDRRKLAQYEGSPAPMGGQTTVSASDARPPPMKEPPLGKSRKARAG